MTVMPYAMITKNGIAMGVTKEQFHDLVKGLDRDHMMALVFDLADTVGELRRNEVGPIGGSGPGLIPHA